MILVSLSMGEKILILLKRKKMTISQLAAIIGTSNQNLSNKLTRDDFSEQELHKIAEAFGCRFEGFSFLKMMRRYRFGYFNVIEQLYGSKKKQKSLIYLIINQAFFIFPRLLQYCCTFLFQCLVMWSPQPESNW